MRRLVEPSPSVRCELCAGELLLKRVEPDASVFETDVDIYVCVKCGHEESRRVTHDPYAPRVPKLK
jgi:DNA-directed RNA polymerase subunit RPC12/RpoP